MSRHEGVSCDNCKQNHIRGLRFKCLICFNFDLCQDCHLGGAEPSNHTKDHPMQCILTKNDSDLYFGGELDGHQEAFACPYCGRLGLTEDQLEDHVNREHVDDDQDRVVQCPICAVGGTEIGAREDFFGHLTISHRSGPLSGLLPGGQRLRRGAGRGGRRGDSLVDLLAHLGATTPARVPIRSTIHHPQPQSAQILSPTQPSTSRQASQSSHHNSRLLLTKKFPRSESNLTQTEQTRSEKSLFVRQLVLSLLSDDVRKVEHAPDGDHVRDVLAEPLHQEGAGDEGRQDGGEGGQRCQASGRKEGGGSS